MELYEKSKPSRNKASKVAKTTSAKAKDLVRSTSQRLQKNRPDSFASAKDTTQLTYAEMQKNVKQGWDKTRTWLAVGIALAATFIQQNMRKAQEKLEQAQKNLQEMQGPIQSNVRSGMTKTSDVIGKSTIKARSGFQQATTKAKERQSSWQEQSTQRQRRRKQAKALFRWGLICGVALALLYSPMTGSEMRQRLGKGWQQSSAFLRSRRRNVGVLA
jgi:hypothetical protein